MAEKEKGFNVRSINKFNIYWQIVRVKAKEYKDVNDKIEYVLTFLDKYPNIHNYGRVLNWMQMTMLAYQGDKKAVFKGVIKDLIDHRKDYEENPEDMPNDLSKISKENLEMVYKDLQNRKYGFLIASAPKSHIDFVRKLEKALGK